MIRLNEDAARLKKIYFPKYGGTFGSFNEVINKLFVDHCKQFQTVEYWESEKKNANSIVDQQNLISENCDIKIKQIFDKEFNKLSDTWKTMSESATNMKDFMIETIKVMNKPEFELESRLMLFNNKFKQSTSLDFFTKLIKFIKEQ